jgi:hypothetical protein
MRIGATLAADLIGLHYQRASTAGVGDGAK